MPLLSPLQADVEKLHKLLANTFSSDDLDAEKLQQQLAEAQIFKLQKNLEQLHTGAGQMNVHLQAAQQSQRDAQVPGCFVDACHMLSFIMTWFCLFCELSSPVASLDAQSVDSRLSCLFVLFGLVCFVL